ncbi:hypothetical protein [Brevibacillus reuszeri]|uniref:hypothetical protein n=1 Tax=Brevibacillus reuszeri TaxID=54915 RepID=UPI000CCC2CAD|nr:hypothetical protein [Brevibacillus reuszeri]
MSDMSKMAVRWMVNFIIEASQCNGMDGHPFAEHFHQSYGVFLEWIDEELTKEELDVLSEAVYDVLSDMSIFAEGREMFFEQISKYITPHSPVLYEVILREYNELDAS